MGKGIIFIYTVKNFQLRFSKRTGYGTVKMVRVFFGYGTVKTGPLFCGYGTVNFFVSFFYAYKRPSTFSIDTHKKPSFRPINELVLLKDGDGTAPSGIGRWAGLHLSVPLC